jgi:hypothetical protein
MRSRYLVTLAGVVMTVASFHAIADDWGRYANVRFAYAIDIPPGFSGVAEAENSDGGVSASADGSADLRVWGGYLVDRDFKSDIAARVQSDTSEGWVISYDRRTGSNASWSGAKGSRVFYARSIKGCDDAAIHFRLEYDRADLDAYHDIVGRLVKSLHPTC